MAGLDAGFHDNDGDAEPTDARHDCVSGEGTGDGDRTDDRNAVGEGAASSLLSSTTTTSGRVVAASAAAALATEPLPDDDCGACCRGRQLRRASSRTANGGGVATTVDFSATRARTLLMVAGFEFGLALLASLAVLVMSANVVLRAGSFEDGLRHPGGSSSSVLSLASAASAAAADALPRPREEPALVTRGFLQFDGAEGLGWDVSPRSVACGTKGL